MVGMAPKRARQSSCENRRRRVGLSGHARPARLVPGTCLFYLFLSFLSFIFLVVLVPLTVGVAFSLSLLVFPLVKSRDTNANGERHELDHDEQHAKDCLVGRIRRIDVKKNHQCREEREERRPLRRLSEAVARVLGERPVNSDAPNAD
jgi:hypothetical protein